MICGENGPNNRSRRLAAQNEDGAPSGILLDERGNHAVITRKSRGAGLAITAARWGVEE